MRFTDALDRKLEDIKRPPNPPVGHYTWQVRKHPETAQFESRTTGKTFDRVVFSMVCVAPMDDVDIDDLEEYGNVAGFVTSKTFLFDNEDDQAFERSMSNLKRFLDHLNVPEDLELGEALATSVGMQCIAELKHRPDPNDAEVVYAELDKTAKL